MTATKDENEYCTYQLEQKVIAKWYMPYGNIKHSLAKCTFVAIQLIAVDMAGISPITWLMFLKFIKFPYDWCTACLLRKHPPQFC